MKLISIVHSVHVSTILALDGYTPPVYLCAVSSNCVYFVYA